MTSDVMSSSTVPRLCAHCGGALAPINHEHRIERRGKRPIVIQLPAWRCEPCRATSGAVSAGRLAGEGATTVMFIERPWRRVDRRENAEGEGAHEDEIEPPLEDPFDFEVPSGWEERVAAPDSEDEADELDAQVLDGRPVPATSGVTRTSEEDVS